MTFHINGSISVADDGRGTDTRRDHVGRIVRKPVMATKDLRFFDQEAAVLPDGRAPRGMSVVAAQSDWLEHTNYRGDGAWVQRYDHGVPASELVAVPSSGSTGTTVRFRPDEHLVAATTLDPASYAAFRRLSVSSVTE